LNPEQIVSFILNTRLEDLPDEARRWGRRCLLDTLGAAIGGRAMPMSAITYDHVAAVYGGRQARLWLDGRSVSAPGAALAHGMTIDALDIHDGHMLTKGHAGAALIPAALATVSLERDAGFVSGRELLASLVVGYEIAIRAGMALHATACDYHTSGAWNALGCAAITARRLKLDAGRTRHALGIAEYHGPRSPMMRDIDYPTMVKDGSGWGAFVGVSAAMMAARGFTGAPALTVEGADVAQIWADLGQHWTITEQYFKSNAICRWAQPAMHGAQRLQRTHAISLEEIRRIRVFTFREASRLTVRHPQTTEEAQYSLPFAVAAVLVHGHLGPDELSGSALSQPQVLALADRVELIEDDAFSARYPAERVSRVEIETLPGERFDSGEVKPEWDVTAPPTDEELGRKFRWLVADRLPASRAAALEARAWHVDQLADAEELNELLAD
jgi:2-methylcitrate dehydratase PrpD